MLVSEVMEGWRQTCQHQERRSKRRHKTKGGCINSLPLQTQLCSCEPYYKRRTVLFMSSRPWFLCLSCASNHMTSTLWCKADSRGQTGGCEKYPRPVAGRLLQSGVRRTWEVSWGGASQDRTSTLSLCRGEDPCSGLFVFSVLSPIPILPHPPNPTALPESWDSSSSELCVWSVLSVQGSLIPPHPSLCPRPDLRPSITTLLQMEKH